MAEGKVSPSLLKRQDEARKRARRRNRRAAEGLGRPSRSFSESLRDTIDKIISGPPPVQKDK